jgi:hypothetical protein
MLPRSASCLARKTLRSVSTVVRCGLGRGRDVFVVGINGCYTISRLQAISAYRAQRWGVLHGPVWQGDAEADGQGQRGVYAHGAFRTPAACLHIGGSAPMFFIFGLPDTKAGQHGIYFAN